MPEPRVEPSDVNNDAHNTTSAMERATQDAKGNTKTKGAKERTKKPAPPITAKFKLSEVLW